MSLAVRQSLGSKHGDPRSTEAIFNYVYLWESINWGAFPQQVESGPREKNVAERFMRRPSMIVRRIPTLKAKRGYAAAIAFRGVFQFQLVANSTIH